MKTKKRLLSILLSLVLALGLMPGMSLTTYAATSTYTNLKNNMTVVKFNNHDWYIIADNSTAVDAGTVTLLAADNSFGRSKFDNTNSSNAYSTSTVKGILDALTAPGGAFAAVKDVIVDTNLTDITPNVTGAKLYLLSKSEAEPYKNLTFDGQTYGCWWLRTPGTADSPAVGRAMFVDGDGDGVNYFSGFISEGGYLINYGSGFGIRPALKLDLSKVTFNSTSKTFSVGKADPVATDFDFTAPASLTYDNTAKSATVTAKTGVTGMGTISVGYYSDASCTVPATPKNAGTYYVGISVTEGSDYNAATLHGNSWWFTIAKANFAPVASYGSWTYGETAGTGSVSVNPGNGTVTWTYSTSQTGTYSTTKPTNAGTYYAKATVGETANYNSATTAPVSFTISRADIQPSVSLRNWHEGSNAFEPEITGVMEDADVVYTYALRGSDNYTEDKPTEAGRYTVKATVAQTLNYNSGEATANFMILEDESSDLTVRSPLTTVTRVTMNGTVINSRYYTVSGGSVYFTEDFLESLKPGVYTIKVTDGNTTATTTYRVSGGAMGSVVLSATTADPGLALYAALAVSATLGLGYMGKKRKED